MIKLRKIPGSHPKSTAGIVIEREGQQSLIITPITILRCLRYHEHKNKNLIKGLDIEYVNAIRKAFNAKLIDDNGNIIKPK